MIKNILTTITGCALFFATFGQLPYLVNDGNQVKIDKEKYQDYINNHPYSTRPPMLKEDIKKINKKDRPDLAYEHDWLMTHDPKTGKIEWDRLIPVINQLNQGNQVMTVAPGGSTSNQWTERGPNNVGGRARTLMFDPTDITNKKAFAGSVGGGLWYNTDVTSSTTSWTAVDDFWANLAVSCMAYDPTNTSTWYVGTGEGFGNIDAIRGAGVWKTTNAGLTWTQLSSTSGSSYRYVMDLVVTSTGRLVVASNGGLYTSDNGGTSFTRRQTSTYYADIEIAANGDLYAGTRYSGKLYKSTNNGTSWTLITNLGGNPERIEIACAPSDSSRVYVVSSGGSGDTDTEFFKKSSNGGSTWTTVAIPTYASNSAKHFTRGQAWYDLILWVHPTNKDMVIAGGVDLHRTTNGGTSWSPISYWNNGQSPLPEVHADQHMIISRPGNNNEILIGNDGGVYYSSNAGNSTVSAPTFAHRVKNFNVTQFYSAAMHPSANSNIYLAGAQDNGTQKLSSSTIGGSVEVTGGDGAYCFIDQIGLNVYITSYVYNNWRVSTNNGGNFTYLTGDNTGSFINPADYDDNLNILYSTKSTSNLKRISGIGTSNTATDITIPGMITLASHIRVSPYTTTSSTLFVGSGGDVFKVTNANTTPAATKISPTSFPSGTISCIDIGASESELLVTFSNYGVNSVWYTNNGGTSWVSKEGNLPDMPVRWALFNPSNRSEVILATEIGIWSTDDLSVTSPVWAASNAGFANVRVDMLQYRASDSSIMASTHGRGVFTGRFKVPPANTPVASFTSSRDTICLGDTVTFTSTSTNNPTSYSWTILGGTPNNGTSSSIITSFSTPGVKTVSLKVTNTFGNDSVAQMAVVVSSNPTVSLGNVGPYCVSDPMVVLNQGTPSGGVYSIGGSTVTTFNPSTAGIGSHLLTYTYTNSIGCSNFDTTTISVVNRPTVSATPIANVCAGSSAFTLNNCSPTGGTYSGNGVNGAMFDPSLSGVGSHTIKYLYGSSTCKDSTTFIIQVDSAPNVSLASVGPYCTSDPMITLTQGSPSGGIYSINGSVSTTLNPSALGAGTHSLKYVLAYANGCSDSASTSFVVDTGVTVSATAIPDQCANSPQIILTNGSPSGGTYSGLGVSTQIFTPSVAGVGTHNIKYKVGTSSCGDSVIFTIKVDSVPNVILASVGPYCSSDSARTLTQGTPTGGIYSGTGVVNGKFDPAIAGVGNHTIKYVVTNSLGCSDSATTIVSVSTGSSPTIGTFNPVCEGSAPFTLTGGMPLGGTYSGTGVNLGIFDPVIAGPGTHTISYNHSTSCGVAATTTITVSAKPTLVSSNDTTVCAGTPVRLFSSGASTYSWSPASSVDSFRVASPLATVNNRTTFVVTGTSSGGCFSTDTVIVNVNSLPNVDAGKSVDSTCAGIPYQLNATGAVTYVWSPSMGLSSTTIANPSATILADQVYQVTGTDINGCVNSDSILLVIIKTQNVTLSPFGDACVTGNVITLSGGSPAGGTYSGAGVTNGKFDPKIAGLGTHVITYTVSGGGSCPSIATNTITVTNSPTITWNTKLVYCENDSIVFPSALPSGGSFSGTALTNSIIDPGKLGAGSYELIYIYSDSTGCSATSSKEITVHPANIDSILGIFTAIINRTYNYSVVAINGSTYTWNLTGGSFLSKNGNSVTVKWGSGPSGFLTVSSSNQYGCMDSTSAKINIVALSEEEFALGNSKIKVYPNPAQKFLNIQLSESISNSEFAYRMISVDGKEYLSGEFNVTEGKQVFELNIENIPEGLYFVVCDGNDDQVTIPVIVSK
ncbi:MAG: T9SS type A sorting domain-containing protein [Salibacteraceae bacterium]